MWFDVAITLSCAGCGLVCGWIMCAVTGFDNDHYHVRTEERGACGQEGEGSAGQLCQVASRLNEFTGKLVENINAHQTRVQAVSEKLQELGTPSSEVVFAAVAQLIQSNEFMVKQLQSEKDRIQQQTMHVESAERRAETDLLTQMPNRRAFDAHLRQRHAAGPEAAGTLALLDVDLFKQFNDIYGHRFGDEVLRVVANVLQTHLQPHGLVARFGGEEFAIMLDDCPAIEAASKIEQARVEIGQLVMEVDGQSLKIEASAGVATLMEDETVESWLQRTDDALYHSKSQGRNCAHQMQGNEPALIELNPDALFVPNVKRLSIDDSGSDERVSDSTLFSRVKDNAVVASLENGSSLEKLFNDRAVVPLGPSHVGRS
ncbi:MAG: hypothetical protein CMM01_01750 [Rhodopirellula sp.]|nr:hypothetical protein [Rhodopirellula sp.]OUX52424.1 MAG: hypothetical protein CBE43_00900 [Rhodopirellula sp. TMED283]